MGFHSSLSLLPSCRAAGVQTVVVVAAVAVDGDVVLTAAAAAAADIDHLGLASVAFPGTAPSCWDPSLGGFVMARLGGTGVSMRFPERVDRAGSSPISIATSLANCELRGIDQVAWQGPRRKG